MAFSILLLGITRKLDEDNEVVGKTAIIGISQDGGTEYWYPEQRAAWANASTAQIKSDLNTDAASLYTEAQANGRVVDLFNDVSPGRLAQAQAEANRERFNAFIGSILAATSLANAKTLINTAFPRTVNNPNDALTAAMDRTYLRNWLDTNPDN